MAQLKEINAKMLKELGYKKVTNNNKEFDTSAWFTKQVSEDVRVYIDSETGEITQGVYISNYGYSEQSLNLNNIKDLFDNGLIKED